MRDAIRSAALAVLAVVSIAFAAATLDSTTVAERSGSSGTGTGAGEGSGAGVEPVPLPDQPGSPGETLVVPFLEEVVLLFLLLAALAVLAYAIVNWRQSVALAVGGVVLLLAVFVLLQLLPPASRSALPPLETGGGGGGGAEATRTRPPLFAVVVVVGLVLAGAAVFLGGRSEGEEYPAVEDDDGADGSERAAAVGRAAGRAADRMEERPDAENEVYRAWREMTELLELPAPATSTPGEFAAAAVEAGLGSEDVAELTRLFEDARYGGAEPTGSEEERAVAVFRRIEARYAEADA